MAEKKYEYGLTEEDTRPGLSWSQPANLFYPYRREVIKAPVEERTRVDDRYVPSFTPGEYGEKEFGLKHMPFVRGIGSLYDFAGKFFSNPEVREKALTAAGKGIATLFEDQYLAAINAGRGGDLQYYDPKKGRVVNWDPFLVPGPAAVAGRLFPVAGGGFTTGMFAGVRAKTADLDKLKTAKKMEEDGASRTEIRRKTTWFRDVDNEWKFEIPDRPARLKLAEKDIPEEVNILEALRRGETPDLNAPSFISIRAEDLIHHPEFFAAYPEFKNIPIRITRKETADQGDVGGKIHGTEARGYYPEKSMLKDPKTFPDPKLIDDVEIELVGPYEELLRSALHEFQHVIQFRENFAMGSNPATSVTSYQLALRAEVKRLKADNKNSEEAKALQDELNRVRSAITKGDIDAHSSFEHYLKHGGEAEARNVEFRHEFTAQEIADLDPWETTTIPVVVKSGDQTVFGPAVKLPEKDIIVVKPHSGEAWTGRGKAAGGFIDKPLYDDQRMIG